MKIDSSLKIAKGMRDIGVDQSALWFEIEDCLRQNFEQFAYQNIRTPILEKTQLFIRSVGEDTDIVQKEMFHFVDQGDENLCLRPELTAPIVRALIESGDIRNLPIKLFSIAPAFRRERPQKGRYRQFMQADVEVFGVSSFEIETELILLSQKIFNGLGLNNIRLEINSLGDAKDRKAHNQALIDYFNQNINQLDETSKARYQTNPLRVLDSKNPKMKELITNAPKISQFMSDDAQTHFENWQSCLNEFGIDFEVNPNLVRGIDYYNRSVFEWISNDDELGSGSTICGGGRYDYLVSEITKNSNQITPAIGFAIGLDRLVVLIQKLKNQKDNKVKNKVIKKIFIINDLENNLANKKIALGLLKDLSEVRNDLIIENHISSKKVGKQFEKAKQSKADLILTLSQDGISIKNTQTNQNFNVEIAEFIDWFNQNYAS